MYTGNINNMRFSSYNPVFCNILIDFALTSFSDAFSHRFVTQDHTSRPVFLEKPKSLTAEEGQCIRFTCRLKGQPLPVVRWEKDGCQIIGDRFQVSCLFLAVTYEHVH